MPCDGSHMEPSPQERQSQEACQLIVWLCERRGLKVPGYAREGSKSIYGTNVKDFDKLIARTCKLCEDAGDEVIYADARDPEMRRVATWWEAHKEQDRLKIERIKADDRMALLQRAARYTKILTDEGVKDVIAFAIEQNTRYAKSPRKHKKTPRANSNKAGG